MVQEIQCSFPLGYFQSIRCSTSPCDTRDSKTGTELEDADAKARVNKRRCELERPHHILYRRATKTLASLPSLLRQLKMPCDLRQSIDTSTTQVLRLARGLAGERIATSYQMLSSPKDRRARVEDIMRKDDSWSTA